MTSAHKKKKNNF